MGISVPAPCLVFGEHGDSCAVALLRTSTRFCLCKQKEQSKVLATLEGMGALVLASVSSWPCRIHGKGGPRQCKVLRAGDVREQNPFRLCPACASDVWLYRKQHQWWEKAVCSRLRLPKTPDDVLRCWQEKGKHQCPTCAALKNTHPPVWGGGQWAGRNVSYKQGKNEQGNCSSRSALCRAVGSCWARETGCVSGSPARSAIHLPCLFRQELQQGVCQHVEVQHLALPGRSPALPPQK